MPQDKQYKRCADCEKKKNSDFSCFFTHATKEQQKELLSKVAKEAFEEQENMLRKHKDKQPKEECPVGEHPNGHIIPHLFPICPKCKGEYCEILRQPPQENEI